MRIHSMREIVTESIDSFELNVICADCTPRILHALGPKRLQVKATDVKYLLTSYNLVDAARHLLGSLF